METVLFTREKETADLAEKLAFRPVVTVDVVCRRIATGTPGVRRDCTALVSADRRQDFHVVGPLVFTSQMFPVLMRDGNDLGEFICLELLVFRGVRIIESPLPKRNKTAKQAKKHTVLLI